MGIMNRLFRHAPKHYIIPACIGAAIALLSLLRNGFSARLHYVDALTVAGAVVIFLGLLGLVGHLGGFDVFGYSFSMFGTRRYKTLYDYSTAKQELRSRGGWTFAPYLLVGAVYLAVGLLLWL